MKNKRKRKRERARIREATTLQMNENNRQADSVENNPSDKNPTVCVDPATVAKIVPSQLKQPQPEYCQYSPTPRWKTILEGFALVCGIGYAIVTGMQWWDLRRNFQLDERPWVAISDQAIIVTQDRMDAEVAFTNSGKTPARNVQKSVQMKIAHSPLVDKPSDADEKSLVFSGHSVLGPQAKTRERAGTTSEVDPKVALALKDALKQSFSYIESGEDILYLFGEIKYEDTSGGAHITRYCFHAVKLESGWWLAECNGFNEMN